MRFHASALQTARALLTACVVIMTLVISAGGSGASAPSQPELPQVNNTQTGLLTFFELDAAFSGLTHRLGFAAEDPGPSPQQSTACHDLFGNLGPLFDWHGSEQMATVAFRDKKNCANSQYEIRETIVIYPNSASGKSAASRTLRNNVKFRGSYYRSDSITTLDAYSSLFSFASSQVAPDEQFAAGITYPLSSPLAPKQLTDPYHAGLGFVCDNNVIIVLESTGPGPGGYLDLRRFAPEALAKERCALRATAQTPCPPVYTPMQATQQ